MPATEYLVSGMSCAHCEAAIRAEVGAIAGVSAVEVSARTGRLEVASDVAVDDSAVLAAVEEAGYTAVPA
jgi:copper chaperone CopZ